MVKMWQMWPNWLIRICARALSFPIAEQKLAPPIIEMAGGKVARRKQISELAEKDCDFRPATRNHTQLVWHYAVYCTRYRYTVTMQTYASNQHMNCTRSNSMQRAERHSLRHNSKKIAAAGGKKTPNKLTKQREQLSVVFIMCAAAFFPRPLGLLSFIPFHTIICLSYIALVGCCCFLFVCCAASLWLVACGVWVSVRILWLRGHIADCLRAHTLRLAYYVYHLRLQALYLIEC